MPALNVNYTAVLVAALAGFALGLLWYSRFLFGRRWERAAGISASDRPAGRLAWVGVLVTTLIFNLLSALVIAMYIIPSDGIYMVLIVTAAIGLGCVASSLGISYALTRRPSTLLMIDGGFHLVRFALLGLILTFWR